MKAERQKLKLLYLTRILFEETDEEHGLTMPQIISRLQELEIDAERKAVYRDLAALREFGMAVEKLPKTSPVQYALVEREFSQPELLLLVDAVQSSRFLTKSKSEALVRSIRTLGSKRQATSLDKRLHVEGRIKMQNESVFYNVDRIQEAIKAKRKVRFHYFKYDASKRQKLQHDGEFYEETPVQLVYTDGYYYLVAYSDKYENFTNYRVDRMVDIEVSENRSTKCAAIATFDIAEYEVTTFGMYAGDPVHAVLRVQEHTMSAVIDRFGKRVKAHNMGDGTARVNVDVKESPTFYGWLTQFGGDIRIEMPHDLAQRYADYLKGIAGSYS